MKNRTKLIRAIPAVLALLLLAACGNVGSSGGGGPSGGGGGPTITVGSKNFTEQYVLGELYAQALAANGFNVEKKLDLGSVQIADKALQKGQIDMYPEYTGTSLVTVLGYEGGNPPTPEATYQKAKELYAKREPADTMLTPAPFNNTYGIFVRKQVAEQQNLKTLADLAEASPELAFVTFSEFQERDDGYPNMQKNYPAFDFGDIVIVNSIGGPIYQGVVQGEGDVGVGFTTDGQLASDELVVMEALLPGPRGQERRPGEEPQDGGDTELGLRDPRRRDHAEAQRSGGYRTGGPRGRRRGVPPGERPRRVERGGKSV